MAYIGPKDALDEEWKRAGFAFLHAHHLLLHDALERVLREDAVEVRKRDAQKALAGLSNR